MLPWVTFRPVRTLFQRLPCAVVSLTSPLHATQAYTILLCCKTLSFFHCQLHYRLTAVGFLCYSVHEKSPPWVWWFVVNSLYHIEDDFSSFFGSHHFSLAHTIFEKIPFSGGINPVTLSKKKGKPQKSNPVGLPQYARHSRPPSSLATRCQKGTSRLKLLLEKGHKHCHVFNFYKEIGKKRHFALDKLRPA